MTLKLVMSLDDLCLHFCSSEVLYDFLTGSQLSQNGKHDPIILYLKQSVIMHQILHPQSIETSLMGM